MRTESANLSYTSLKIHDFGHWFQKQMLVHIVLYSMFILMYDIFIVQLIKVLSSLLTETAILGTVIFKETTILTATILSKV